MIATWASRQGLILGPLLVLGAFPKIRTADEQVPRLAFARLARRWFQTASVAAIRKLWRAIAIIELTGGVLLFTGIEPRPVGLAGSTLAASALGLVTWALLRTSGSSCGCFGTTATVKPATLLRSALSLIAGLSYAAEGRSAWEAVNPGAISPYAVMLVALELVAFAALSADEIASAV